MEKARWFQRIIELFLGGVGGIWTLAPLFRRPTPLAGAPLRPLEYYSRAKCVTLIQKNGGESGIRTHGTLPYGSFQDCFLKPLGHLSLWTLALRRVECLFTLPDLRRSVKPLCKFFLFSVRQLYNGRIYHNLYSKFFWNFSLQKHLFVV